MRRAYATVVGYRRPIRVNIRRKKPSNHNPSVDPCKDCKRLPAWYRVEEVVKYEWKNRTTKQSGVNPCICWSGSLDESDCQRKEYEFRKNFFVDTRITKCRNGMKVEFIRNGDDVRDAVQEEEQILLAEQMRMDEIRKEEREKKNLQRLKGILRKWEEDFNFPLLSRFLFHLVNLGFNQTNHCLNPCTEAFRRYTSSNSLGSASIMSVKLRRAIPRESQST